MKPLLILSALIGLCFCTNKPSSPLTECAEDSIPIIEKPISKLRDYDSLKLEIAAQKTQFLNSHSSGNKEALTKAGTYLDSMICEEFFPHWLGTPWDFNGHTDEPNNGLIACGYLVSTLLKHADLKINRYKLAQQSSFNEIKTLAYPDAPLFLGSTAEKAIEKMKEMDDGLYILGMSFHVGFIRIKAGELHFLHSTYLSPGSVVNELASESEAFRASDVYYLGKISGNQELMKKWITSSQISIFFD